MLDIFLQNKVALSWPQIFYNGWKAFFSDNIHQPFCRNDVKHKISVANTPREFVFHGTCSVYFYTLSFYKLHLLSACNISIISMNVLYFLTVRLTFSPGWCVTYQGVEVKVYFFRTSRKLPYCSWLVLVSDANGLIKLNLDLTFLQRVRFVFVHAFELSFIEH